MSTLKLENIKHENSSTNNMVMDSDGSVSTTGNATVGGTLGVTGALTVDTETSGLPSVNLKHSNSGADNFQLVSGTPGVANSGFSIRDIDAAANRLVINSAGKVGIGTSTPSKVLDITQSTSDDNANVKLTYAGGDGNRSGFILNNTHTGGREYGIYAGNNSTGGGLGSSLGISDNTAGTAYRLLINSDGYVTMPNQPSFSVNGTGGWQTVTSGNTQVIAFNTVHSNVSSSYNSSNYRFTAPVAGVYVFMINAYCRLETQDDDSNHAYIFLRKNGVTYINAMAIYGYYNSGDVDQTQNVCCTMTMAVGDYATADINAASGDASVYRGASTFSGFLMG